MLSSFPLSTILMVWTPFDLLMNERLEMRRGLPPFEWWASPPDPTLRVFIFNVTNSREFLRGLDAKLKVKEVGPVVFREVWRHTNVIFNPNSTISYNLRKTPIYEPDWNRLDLDSIVTIPNMALLGSASYISDMPLFVKYGFRSLVAMLETKPFVNLTIRNFLYNFSDPLVKFVHDYAPAIAPTDNMGVLNNLYEPYGDNVTAFFGISRGHRSFSLIDRYNGRKGIPGHPASCKDEITNASEAVMFNQFVSKRQVLKYYRKSLCRVASLVYEGEVRKYGITGYKFVVPENVFDRKFPLEADCYKGEPPLMNGLSDLSNCLYSFPLAGSFPHFLYGDQRLRERVIGLEPNIKTHRSYILVEPITGVPMEEKAMIQLNVRVRTLKGFNKILEKRFSDTIVPIFWLEFSMMELPYYVLILIYFILISKYLQWVIIGVLFTCGIRNITRCLHRKETEGKSPEIETFLKGDLNRFKR